MISRPSNPTSDDLARLISAGPDKPVAFAPASAGPGRLAETLAALANTHGGVLLVGINAAGRPTGIADAGEARARALANLRPAGLPAVDLAASADDRGRWQDGVLRGGAAGPAARVQHGRALPNPHRRAESAAQRGRAVRAAASARGEAGFESRPVSDATLDDLDPALVQAFLEKLGFPLLRRWRNRRPRRRRPCPRTTSGRRRCSPAAA